MINNVWCPHYAAESLSWYSRDRLKQAWTPLSFHSLWITPASSSDITPSSAVLARANSCRASSCQQTQWLHCNFAAVVVCTTTTRLKAYLPNRIVKIHLQLSHRLDNSHDWLDGVAVHHHFVLLALIFSVAILVNDSATETKSKQTFSVI